MELFIGIAIGTVITYLAFCRKPEPVGTFLIDFSDPAKDVCRLEFDVDINDIYERKQVVLNVVTYDFPSQE